MQFPFETTVEVEELTETVGQARAVEAVRFGIGIRHEGYNLFALGPTGTGKRSLVEGFLRQRASGEPTPSDWCYVNNFEQPHKPRALRLPPGWGVRLRREMERLVEELRDSLSTAFESDQYRTRRQEIEETFKERQEQAVHEVQQQGQTRGIALLHTPARLAFAPMRAGEVISPEAFQKLPAQEQERMQAEVVTLQGQLQRALQQLPQWERERRTQVKELNREVAMSASSVELYALLSALAEVLIRQSLAVTGSVNQHGQVQPMGGVNEKIEGFFDLCRARGLTEEQGVLIPASNGKHLMLRHDVVEAVAAGQFHIYPVETIDAYTDLVAERIAVLGGVARSTARTAATQSTLPEYPDAIVEGHAHVWALAPRAARGQRCGGRACGEEMAHGRVPSLRVRWCRMQRDRGGPRPAPGFLPGGHGEGRAGEHIDLIRFQA